MTTGFTHNSRGRSVARSVGHRVATAGDLQRYLDQEPRAEPGPDLAVPQVVAGLAATSALPASQVFPPRASDFLAGLPATGAPYEPRRPATKRLARLIEENGYRAAFRAAIERVARQRIPEISRIKTLDQFYFYIDELVAWIPEIRSWEMDGETLHERTVYLRVIQIYYYFNQPELERLQSPIAPLEGNKLTPLSSWLREFAVEWGQFLDTKESAQRLRTFKFAPEYNWQDYQAEPEAYETFNEFFAREFSDIETQRPVANYHDERTIVFPAESTYVGQWAISTPVGDPLPAPASIVVKHIEWSIGELLADSEHASAFEGGLFCHTFLNTYDYHRLHAPVAGKVVEAKFIPGQVYLEVELEKADDQASLPNSDLANAVIPRRYLDAKDPTGYQFVQCRGLLVLETEHFGKVAVLPMGMAQVSSVVFTTPGGHQPIRLTAEEQAGRSYDERVELLNHKIASALCGKHLCKGEMFSFFQFGGSDCVLAFERRANVSITATAGIHYPIRSRLGVANFNKE